jgi:hypothetical protein
MISVPIPPSLFAAAVQQRITSALVDGFTAWWQLPALVVVLGGLACFILWMYRRDAAELPRGLGVLLAALRLGAVAALAAAYLDLERTTEHEIVSPSRVALLIDSSASMTLTDSPADAAASDVSEPPTRGQQAGDLLAAGGLLKALEPRHEVSVWRFDADAEAVAVRPVAAAPEGEQPAADTAATSANSDESAGEPWQAALAPRGFETRLGEALARVLDEEPGGVLAGVVVLSDGANNAGIDPAAAAAALGKAGVPVYPIGIGSDRLPANVRVADLLAPARVFPGDRFSVTGYVQAQEFAGQVVTVELAELAPDEAAAMAREPRAAARRGRLIDSADVRLAADGEVVAVRFDVPGLQATGRRSLVMRVVPPAADRTPADNASLAEIEVVDRVTQVLLIAGGPTREYQFMRNALHRDKSFAVDVVLATASEGVSQDARRILASFPDSAEELDAYDVVVAFDYDWRRLDAAAYERLERWVARESGGLVLIAGSIFMDAWLADPRSTTIRNLHPVELRRSPRMVVEDRAGRADPMPLAFTRDGQDAEFLWLGASRIASQTVWSEFPGVYACFDATVAKPGATVYTRVKRETTPAADAPIHMAGQFYGSGSVFYLGTGEMWRLRALDPAFHERVTTQLVRHVSQGRLLRGSRRARLLVDRDRFAVGSGVTVRVVGADGESSPAGAACTATSPDGDVVRVPLAIDPSRPGAVQGVFLASREGSWLIDVDLGGGERLSRRIQARLPDRELERPRLERGLLEQVATLSGGAPRFLADREWTPADAQALAARLVDRSRRDYETGAPDADFKRRLHALLLGLGVGLLCCEWIVRRLVRLA